MTKSIVEEIREFVEEECKKPTSKYGYEPFENHFVPTHKYAKQLAEKLKADLEIVELAAWLHDIGSIIHGRENHHITGAEIAEEKLKEANYPQERIEKVKKCIFNHRGSVLNNKTSVEEQIIADADAMSAFEHIEGLFRAAYIPENLSQEQAKKSVRQKFINSWNKISPEAKEMVRNKYEAAMLLLK